MPNLTMPDLDKLYREEGLRNSKTMIDGSPIDFTDAFGSFRDFKREVRGLLLVPYIVVREVIGQLLHLLDRLIVATFQLMTLDGRCFNNLFNAFVHLGNAICLACEGFCDTIGTVFSLYFRTVATVVEGLGLLFEEEPTYSEPVMQRANPPSFNRSGFFVPPSLMGAIADLETLQLEDDASTFIVQDMIDSGQYLDDRPVNRMG